MFFPYPLCQEYVFASHIAKRIATTMMIVMIILLKIHINNCGSDETGQTT
jgi:hypothetical protein